MSRVPVEPGSEGPRHAETPVGLSVMCGGPERGGVERGSVTGTGPVVVSQTQLERPPTLLLGAGGRPTCRR